MGLAGRLRIALVICRGLPLFVGEPVITVSQLNDHQVGNSLVRRFAELVLNSSATGFPVLHVGWELSQTCFVMTYGS